ncbi:DNA-binding domain-containing protein [Flammeovirgaceae bacterium 311]|nr:DNA-binding domain-containing protein [Flammeovirgaceae bacterium 311]
MIREVLHHITHHLDEEISLEKLAQLSGYSPFHLHRMLKEELSEPIGNYIKQQRIGTAAYLLSLTQVPVSQIKFLVGYSNDSAFSRAFKDIMKCSPKAYREDNQFKNSIAALEGYLSLKSKTVVLSNPQALLFPSLGNYFFPDTYKVWKDVKEYLQVSGLREDDFEYYGILYGCQTVNPGLNRYDAAILPKPGVHLPKNKFFQSQLSAGKFASYTFCCAFEELKNSCLLIGKHLAEQSGLQHRNDVSYFKYHSLPDGEKLDNLLIDWLLPVQ